MCSAGRCSETIPAWLARVQAMKSMGGRRREAARRPREDGREWSGMESERGGFLGREKGRRGVEEGLEVEKEGKWSRKERFGLRGRGERGERGEKEEEEEEEEERREEERAGGKEADWRERSEEWTRERIERQAIHIQECCWTE